MRKFLNHETREIHEMGKCMPFVSCSRAPSAPFLQKRLDFAEPAHRHQGRRRFPAFRDVQLEQELLQEAIQRELPRLDEKLYLEFFSRDSRPVAVVLHQDQPVGILSRNSILALSRPLQTNTFKGTTQPSVESNYLVVPDLVAVGER